MLGAGASGAALLDQCLARLRELGQSVERTRKLSEGFNWTIPPAPPSSPALQVSPTKSSFTTAVPSPVKAIIEDIFQSSVMSVRAPSRCHECHGPLSSYHKGYPHGIDACELEHYELCKGSIEEGKDRGGHFWRGCPHDFEPADVRGGEFGDVGYKSGGLGMGEDEFSDPSNGLGEHRTSNSPGSPSQKSPTHKSNQMHSSKEDLLLEAEMAELKLMEERNKKLEEVRKKKQLANEEFDRLSRQSSGEGARLKHAMHDNLQYQSETLRASNRVQPQSRREQSGYQGPSIGEMRQDPNTSRKVDSMMGKVREVPAFSNIASPGQIYPQPRLKARHTQPYAHEDTARSGGDNTSPRQDSGEALYKMVTKIDMYGSEYKELVKVSPRPRSVQNLVIDGEDGWSYDQHTGCLYRTEKKYQSPGQQKVVFEQRRSGSSQDRTRQPRRVGQTPYQAHSEERFPGIVPLDNNQPDEREGKLPKSIASHARDMPVEYAKSATAKNINFAMYMYGAISEIHSSRIGISPPLEPGVLEAKLQHLLNVIHVTCMNASPTDFKPVGWSVGRTYHNLVQAKIDSGRESWVDFEKYHRSSPHAAEMIAAEREHRAALNRQPKQEKQPEKKGEKRGDQDKPVCNTWNDFEEEGKCRYESEHPGEKCNRLHECRYCKKKYPGNRTKHQERFCKRKLEDDK